METLEQLTLFSAPEIKAQEEDFEEETDLGEEENLDLDLGDDDEEEF